MPVRGLKMPELEEQWALRPAPARMFLGSGDGDGVLRRKPV